PAINQMNAFQLIGMSSCLDLSGFFEKEVSPIFVSSSHLLVHAHAFYFLKITTKGSI
uniref:NAF domain-containing protein n=1 Tax=Aegilops tauschii subsp. strangulata TaxID=200361 RepID=A0A453AZ37_AEGTS